MIACKKCKEKFTKYDIEYVKNLVDDEYNLVASEMLKFTCPVCSYYFYKKIEQ